MPWLGGHGRRWRQGAAKGATRPASRWVCGVLRPSATRFMELPTELFMELFTELVTELFMELLMEPVGHAIRPEGARENTPPYTSRT